MSITKHPIACVAVATSALLMACGGDDAPTPVTSGLYQLTTSSITGSCDLEDALGPGPLLIGSTLPVAVTSSAVAIEVRVCDHPDAADACSQLGDAFDYGLSRDGDAVVGSQLWLVPGCGDPTIRAILAVSGDITAPDTLTLRWTATITAPDPQWTCKGYAPCTGTVQQRLAPVIPAP